MLRTKIIASSISNLTDARYFAAWGVEAMGFDLNTVSASQIHAFKDWISGPEILGQFPSTMDQEMIALSAQELGLDKIQLDVFAPRNWNFDIPVIREKLIEDATPQEGIFILKTSDLRMDFNKQIGHLRALCQAGECYLDINLEPEQYSQMLDQVKPAGFVLRGGDEEKVGFKSYDQLDEIMEELEVS